MAKSRKPCFFCAQKIDDIDYKDVDLLRRCLTDRGKIVPRGKSGTCSAHQRRLTRSIKHARFMALLPFAVKLG